MQVLCLRHRHIFDRVSLPEALRRGKTRLSKPSSGEKADRRVQIPTNHITSLSNVTCRDLTLPGLTLKTDTGAERQSYLDPSIESKNFEAKG